MQYVSGTADSAVVTVRILDAGSIDANFSGVTYTVQLSSSNNNYGTVSPAIEQVSHNGGFTAIASVKRGCRFLEWVVDSGTMTIDDPYNDTTSVSSVLSGGKIKGLFAEARPVPSKIVCVDINSIGPSGQEDGSTWYRAYKSLETAIADCTTAGTNFWVAEGTYTPSASNPFTPEMNTSLYGGFSPSDSILSERDFVAHSTTLVGKADEYCLHIEYGDTNVIVNGFKITGQDKGVSIEGESVTVENCIVHGIASSAFYIWSDGENKIKNCVITNNQGGCGCALYLDGTPNITTIENCVFYENSSTDQKGVIYLTGSQANFIHVTIVNNKSTHSDSSTAGVFKEPGSKIQLINSLIWNNTTSGPAKGAQIRRLFSADADYVNACLIQDYDDPKGIYDNDLAAGSFKDIIKDSPDFQSQ